MTAHTAESLDVGYRVTYVPCRRQHGSRLCRRGVVSGERRTGMGPVRGHRRRGDLGMSDEPDQDGWLAERAREALSVIASLHADALSAVRETDVPPPREATDTKS